MSSLSYDDLTQRILSLDLLDLGKLRDVENSFGARVFTAEELLQELQRRGYLTKYQVERLRAGETTGFYYGDYRIQYLIGAGSFARVFRCVHKDTGQVVAVKVLRARFREDQTAINEFEREGELGIQMRHPNIAAVYDAKKTKYDHYIVMEFIEGRTLREEVNAQRNGRLEAKRATRIVHDVCSALDYALKRGYQHRDMKLSNILLASSGKAVLLDFGLLTDEGSGFKTQRAIEYAALERSTHVGRDDKRSDLYFLGAVYYQLLTGVAPLGEIKERSKRLDAGRFRQVKPIRQIAPYIPRCVANVVDKALKFNPDERFQTPGLMLEALDAAEKALEAGVDVEQEEKVVVAAMKAPTEKAKQTSVMIVEANPNLQNAFREAFKKAGYRALVVSNCARALERLDDGDAFSVDVVLFNAQSLGPDAVKSFNKLLETNTTKDLPAILLLDENQVKWAASAKRGKKRLAVGMPITMKRLMLVVEKLTQPEQAPAPAPTPAPAAETPAASDSDIKSKDDVKPAAPAPAREESEAIDDLNMDDFDNALEDAFDRLFVRGEKLSDQAGARKPAEQPAEQKPAPANVEPVVFDDPDADSYYLDPEEDHD